jgi:hypothetical protein
LDSQVTDFPIHDFRVLPRKGNFATEPTIEHKFEDGIITQRVGIVGIFVACGDLKHSLFEQVF